MDSRAETLAEDKEAERTHSPSLTPSIDKEKNDSSDQPTDIEGSTHENPSDNVDTAVDEYPSGLRLGAIVVALLLSIFLVRGPSLIFSCLILEYEIKSIPITYLHLSTNTIHI